MPTCHPVRPLQRRRPFLRGHTHRAACFLTTLLLSPLGQAQVLDLGTQTILVVDPDLPFEIRRSPRGNPTFVLGRNVFTPETLSNFIIDIDAFLNRARAATARGAVAVHRVDGERGYLALASNPSPDGPSYLLTLQGEAVRSFQNEAALLATFNRLGRYLIVTLDAQTPPAPPRGARGADARYGEPTLAR